MLLVDSEAPVDMRHMMGQPEEWRPWEHLRHHDSDSWTQPPSCSDTDCHLMVQVMESWFLADKATLEEFFGQGFQVSSLPAQNAIETVSKDAVYQGLENATRACKTKACYGKGTHSFKILARVDPDKVYSASPWAKRLVDTLKSIR